MDAVGVGIGGAGVVGVGVPGGSGGVGSGIAVGPGSRTPTRAQYVSASCVVFTHYAGDTASQVDEHFSRALNFSSKEGKGMLLGGILCCDCTDNLGATRYMRPINSVVHFASARRVKRDYAPKNPT